MLADQMFDAAVFDLDGTLVDSEPLWAMARERLLAKYGIYKNKCTNCPIGGSHLSTAEYLRRVYGLMVAPTVLAAQLAEESNTLLTYWQPTARPGADSILRILYGRVPLALATGASQCFTQRVLDALSWNNYFSAIVTASDVVRPKPSPDSFLRAAEGLRCSPHRCIAFEDSPTGVRSARSAGLFVVGVPDARWVGTLPNAHVIVSSLCELSPKKLSLWFGRAILNERLDKTRSD
jgi:HAD superfamily hydrolase (TIGR01509 family)